MPEHQMRNKGELLANKTTRCKYHGIFMQKDVCVTSTPHNFIFSLISGKSAVNLFGEYVHVEVPCTPQDLQNLTMFLRTLHTYYIYYMPCAQLSEGKCGIKQLVLTPFSSQF